MPEKMKTGRYGKGKRREGQVLKGSSHPRLPKRQARTAGVTAKAKDGHADGTARRGSQKTNRTNRLGAVPMTGGAKRTRRQEGGEAKYEDPVQIRLPREQTWNSGAKANRFL